MENVLVQTALLAFTALTYADTPDVLGTIALCVVAACWGGTATLYFMRRTLR